jgi:hypothetical protein
MAAAWVIHLVKTILHPPVGEVEQPHERIADRIFRLMKQFGSTKYLIDYADIRDGIEWQVKFELLTTQIEEARKCPCANCEDRKRGYMHKLALMAIK